MGKKLSRASDIAAGDGFVIWKTNDGDFRELSLTALMTYLNANLTFPGGFGNYVTQYASPSSTGFSVTITDGSDNDENVHLILTPTAGFAAGTIVLPTAPVDKQEVLVNCTQAITTLTVSGGSNTVTGEPSAMSADDFFRLKFDDPTNVWYRVG